MIQKPFRPPPAHFIKTLYAIGLGPLVGRLILLLTTTGRKTGLARTMPLQYEEVDGAYYVESEGLPARPDRSQLEAYASKLAMVIIRPIEEFN